MLTFLISSNSTSIKVLKYLDDIEERVITEVGSVQEKNEEKINTEKHEICQLTSVLKDNKQELEFLKDHVVPVDVVLSLIYI
jgi:gas vesicle protein